MIRLDHLPPKAEEGCWMLFELVALDTDSWMVVGGQRMHLLAAEHGVSDTVRPTDDVDIVVVSTPS